MDIMDIMDIIRWTLVGMGIVAVFYFFYEFIIGGKIDLKINSCGFGKNEQKLSSGTINEKEIDTESCKIEMTYVSPCPIKKKATKKKSK